MIWNFEFWQSCWPHSDNLASSSVFWHKKWFQAVWIKFQGNSDFRCYFSVENALFKNIFTNRYFICEPILKMFAAHHVISHLSPLTLEVVGASQMTLQQYLSILPCLPLPSGNLQTPFPSIPWCYLPISSSVFPSSLLLSLSLAELSSPCQKILRCGHTIWVSVSLPWLGDHHALQLHSGFCCEPLHSSHGLCRKCSEVSYSISSQGLGSFSLFLLSRSSSHRHKER